MTIELDDNDVTRLVALLGTACAEVDASVHPDAMVQPDDPMALMDSYDWGRGLLARLGHPWTPADPHHAAAAKCRLCNYTCVSVFPVGADADALECPKCGRMTLEAGDDA